MKKLYILGLIIVIVGLGLIIYYRTPTGALPIRYIPSSDETSSEIIFSKIAPIDKIPPTEEWKTSKTDSERYEVQHPSAWHLYNPLDLASTTFPQVDSVAKTKKTILCDGIEFMSKTCSSELSTTGGDKRTQTATTTKPTPNNPSNQTTTPVPEISTNQTPISSPSTSVNLSGTTDEYVDTTTLFLKSPTNVSNSMYHLYVATTGSDSNSGTQSSPFKTITHAASIAKPSTTVHVAPGTYQGNVITTVSGTEVDRIRYESDTTWGATIIGSGTEGMWTNKGDYTDIVGFDITGPGRLGILNYASHTLIASNHVHDLTISGGCTGNGGAGIVNANYKASDGDIIGNMVHDIGVPGACNGVHGIYHSNLGGHIYNNVVYRASSYGIHLWHAANNVVVANNTVFQNGSGGIGGGIVIGTGDSPGGIVLDNTKVINNIVYNNPASGIVEYCYPGQNCIGSNNTVSNNLVYGSRNGISMKVGSALGTISDDPQFVNYQVNGNSDYRLRNTSPAIDKGLSSDSPFTDIKNVTRPLGNGIDLGAYESY